MGRDKYGNYVNEKGVTIVDVNTGKVIDLFSPNWYYEDSSSSHTHSIGNIYSICQ